MIKSLAAEALGVNRKNIYYQTKQETRDVALKAEIETAWEEHPTYGQINLATHLQINHKRVARVMRKFGMKPPRRKVKKFSCTQSTPHHQFYNLIKDWRPEKANQLWCSDTTYLKYQSSFWYLVTVIDVYTREVIGFAVGKKHNSRLVLTAIKQALMKRGSSPQVFHTDQGMEFMAQSVITLLESQGIQISVSDKSSPWQNGYQESFFGKLKFALGDLSRFESPSHLIVAIYYEINYYNNRRIHRSLKMPPAVFANLV